jgi:hypothetical protein
MAESQVALRRERRGELMIRRKLVWGLVWIGAVCALTFGCGNVISTTTTTPDTGGLVILVGDNPACDVRSFRTVVTGLRLESQAEGTAANAFKGVLQPFIKVNFAGLRDTTSLLRVAPVTVGTYDRAQLSFGLTTFAFFDPTKVNFVTIVPITFSNTAGSVNIQPPLTISKGAISAVRIDLDVRHTITVNSQGNLVGSSTPAITLSPVTANSTTGFGLLQDLRGFVLSVTSGSTISEFLGSINIQLHSGTSAVPQVAVNVSPTTTMITADYPDGVSEENNPDVNIKRVIGGILGGSFVEVDGYVDSKGQLVANTVQVEDQENVNTRREALIGTITGITRDLAGNATQLNLFVTEAQPESLFNVGLDTIAQVDITSTTKFNYSSRSINFASLPFDATSMAVGQQVIVHGPSFSGTTNNSTTVDAESVYLNLQTHEGNFSSLVSAGSDDRTGAFWLKTCCTLFQGTPILVFTNNDTAFVNVIGLSAMTPQPSLIVKGLLFYERQSVTINGVTVPSGTLVMLADQVHSVL